MSLNQETKLKIVFFLSFEFPLEKKIEKFISLVSD